MVLFVLSTSTALLIVTKPSPQMLVDALAVSDGVALVFSDSLLTAISNDELSIAIVEFVLPTVIADEIPFFSPDAAPVFFVIFYLCLWDHLLLPMYNYQQDCWQLAPH